MRRRSDGLDVLGLGTLGARAGGELHPLVFLEATVTVSLNNGVVNEDVACTVIWGDETIALVGVEPLHCTLSHFALSPTLNDVRVHVYGPGATATACSQKPDSGNPRRPLSELRRRCDTNTNFLLYQNKSTVSYLAEPHFSARRWAVNELATEPDACQAGAASAGPPG